MSNPPVSMVSPAAELGAAQMASHPVISGHRLHLAQRSARPLRNSKSRGLSERAVARKSARVSLLHAAALKCGSTAAPEGRGNTNTSASNRADLSCLVNLGGSDVGLGGSHNRLTSNGYSSNFMAPRSGARQLPHPRAALSSVSMRRSQTTARRIARVEVPVLGERGENVAICPCIACPSTKFDSASVNFRRPAGAIAVAIAQTTSPSAIQIASGGGSSSSSLIRLFRRLSAPGTHPNLSRARSFHRRPLRRLNAAITRAASPTDLREACQGQARHQLRQRVSRCVSVKVCQDLHAFSPAPFRGHGVCNRIQNQVGVPALHVSNTSVSRGHS